MPMTDIANTLNLSATRERGDAAILTIAGASLLVLFFAIVALLPFDGAPNPAYIPTLFGP
jgi:hypothetical protein